MKILDIKISPAKSEDSAGMQEVFYKAWLATYPNEEHGITRDDIEERFKDPVAGIEQRKKNILEIAGNKKYLVAKVGEQIVGLCRVVKHEDRNELQAIYVLPEYQGKGIGYALWQETKKFFDPTKDTIVQVATYNKKAITFYEKLGFRDNGKRFTEERFRMKSGNIMPEMEMVLKSEK